jgi:hypothetical protein
LLFVSEEDHRTQVLDSGTGQVVLVIGDGKGPQPGQLSFPQGLALNVADCVNNRVQAFNAITGEC